jgi:hypothetical protein
VHTSLLPHTRHMALPSHSSRFYHRYMCTPCIICNHKHRSRLINPLIADRLSENICMRFISKCTSFSNFIDIILPTALWPWSWLSL